MAGNKILTIWQNLSTDTLFAARSIPSKIKLNTIRRMLVAGRNFVCMIPPPPLSVEEPEPVEPKLLCEAGDAIGKFGFGSPGSAAEIMLWVVKHFFGRL